MMAPEDATARLQTIPFVRAMGMFAKRSGIGEAVTAIPNTPAVLALPASADFSDGVIAAAIDQAGSASVWSEIGLTTPHATVSLSITFLGSTDSAELELHSRALNFNEGLGHTVVDVVGVDGAKVAHAMVNYVIGVYPGDSSASATTVIDDPEKLSGQRVEALSGQGLDAAMGLIGVGPGEVRMPFRINLVGSRGPIALHGGAIAAGMIAAARSAIVDAEQFRLSHFVIDYLRSGLEKETTFRAVTIARSRKAATLRIDAYQDDGARHVATATTRYFIRT